MHERALCSCEFSTVAKTYAFVLVLMAHTGLYTCEMLNCRRKMCMVPPHVLIVPTRILSSQPSQVRGEVNLYSAVLRTALVGGVQKGIS